MVETRTRGRRRVVSSQSDEDGEETTDATVASPTSVKQQIKQPPTPTPSPQVKKQRATAKKAKAGSEAPTSTIYSFFNTATLKQQERAKEERSRTQHDVNDIDEDDISEDDTKSIPSKVKQLASVAGIKRTFSTSQTLEPSTTVLQQLDSAPKYLKNSTGGKALPALSNPSASASKTTEEDRRPWTEKYGPGDVGDVVVHKKKVSDVRNWLEASLAGQPFKKLLVLKGPAGSGKTATIKCLSSVLNFSLLEWKSPTGYDFGSGEYQSLSMQFEEFVSRGRVFGGLELASEDGQTAQSVESDASQKSSQVILVEDFPHTILRSSAALQTFRSSLLQCLAVPDNGHGAPRPIVLIISESATVGHASMTDVFTAHRLLGAEVLHHPNVNIIEFNAVATTFVSKALKLVLEKHEKATSVIAQLSSEVLAKIAEIGDLRNATSTLEYLVLGNTSVSLPASSKTKARSSKSETKAVKSDNASQRDSAALSYISLRESSLGLFHATGRVLYNKRTIAESSQTSSSSRCPPLEETLPVHTNNLARNMHLDFTIASLMDEAGTDVSTFISTLHENYPLSCYDPRDSAAMTLDALNGCLDALCDADLILPTTTIRNAINEGVQQEELAFHAAVAGVMFNLPYPVHRRPPPNRGKADAHRMFYPTGLKLWRRKEELIGLVDILAEKAQTGTLLGGIELPIKPTRSISQPGRMILTTGGQISDEHGKGNGVSSLGSGQSARYEMLVERLPYMSHILASAPRPPTLLRQVQQVTQFTGAGIVQDDNEDDASGNQGPSNMFSRRSAGIGTAFPRDRGTTEDLDVKGLVLSDDDIEDD